MTEGQTGHFVEVKEVDIVALLAKLVEIVEGLPQLFGDLASLDKTMIEETAVARVLARLQVVAQKKSGNGIETGVVEAVGAREPTLLIGEETSVVERLASSPDTVRGAPRACRGRRRRLAASPSRGPP